MIRLLARTLLAAFALGAFASASFADDWTAVRLRGQVLVYNDGWVKLERGDVVSDDSIIRTLTRGRVSFVRGAETIDLLPDSQIRIVDQTGRKFTTVMSDYGTVEIEAEVQNVEHFAVATPFLAAVVKGTSFSVSSTDVGSQVSVKRGRVLVQDGSSRDSVTIVAGQTASSSSSDAGEPLIVTETASSPASPGAGPTTAPKTAPANPGNDNGNPGNSGDPNPGKANNGNNGDPGNGNDNPGNNGNGNPGNNGNGNPGNNGNENPGNGNGNPGNGNGRNN